MASNREERQQMRMRGAASRKAKEVDFGFSFGLAPGPGASSQPASQPAGIGIVPEPPVPPQPDIAAEKAQPPPLSPERRLLGSQDQVQGQRTPGSARNNRPARPSTFDIPDDAPDTGRSIKRRKIESPTRLSPSKTVRPPTSLDSSQHDINNPPPLQNGAPAEPDVQPKKPKPTPSEVQHEIIQPMEPTTTPHKEEPPPEVPDSTALPEPDVQEHEQAQPADDQTKVNGEKQEASMIQEEAHRPTRTSPRGTNGKRKSREGSTEVRQSPETTVEAVGQGEQEPVRPPVQPEVSEQQPQKPDEPPQVPPEGSQDAIEKQSPKQQTTKGRRGRPVASSRSPDTGKQPEPGKDISTEGVSAPPVPDQPSQVPEEGQKDTEESQTSKPQRGKRRGRTPASAGKSPDTNEAAEQSKAAATEAPVPDQLPQEEGQEVEAAQDSKPRREKRKRGRTPASARTSPGTNESSEQNKDATAEIAPPEEDQAFAEVQVPKPQRGRPKKGRTPAPPEQSNDASVPYQSSQVPGEESQPAVEEVQDTKPQREKRKRGRTPASARTSPGTNEVSEQVKEATTENAPPEEDSKLQREKRKRGRTPASPDTSQASGKGKDVSTENASTSEQGGRKPRGRNAKNREASTEKLATTEVSGRPDVEMKDALEPDVDVARESERQSQPAETKPKRGRPGKQKRARQSPEAAQEPEPEPEPGPEPVAEPEPSAPKSGRGRKPNNDADIATDQQAAEQAAQQEPEQGSQPTRKKRAPRGETVPVTVHRLVNVASLGGALGGPDAAEEEEEESADEISTRQKTKLPNRGGVNPADVLSQICRETLEKTLTTLKNGIANETNPARRQEFMRKKKAVEAFGTELDGRLLELSEMLDSNFVLGVQVKKAKREMMDMRSRLYQVRRERESVALQMDAVRKKHAEEESARQARTTINNSLHSLDLAMDRSQNRPDENEAGPATTAGLEFMLRSVGEEVSSSRQGGLLNQIKAFNAQLEATARTLER
ncbi:hypothetical protein AWENTII_009745 [Aspergillus wentii]